MQSDPGPRGTVKKIRLPPPPPRSICYLTILSLSYRYWKKNVYDLLVLLNRSNEIFEASLKSALPLAPLLHVSGYNAAVHGQRKDGERRDNFLLTLKTGPKKNLEECKRKNTFEK